MYHIVIDGWDGLHIKEYEEFELALRALRGLIGTPMRPEFGGPQFDPAKLQEFIDANGRWMTVTSWAMIRGKRCNKKVSFVKGPRP